MSRSSLNQSTILKHGNSLLFGVSIHGARHIQDNSPCQDAYKISTTEEGLSVIAVADGHGDTKHPRSDEGSAIAVDVATKLLSSALLAIENQPNKSLKELEQALAGNLPKRLSWEWNKAIRTLLSAERNNTGRHTVEGSDGEWFSDLVLFGTTILVAALGKEKALLLQLGDGDVLQLTQEGQFHSLFQEDESLYGTLTHSLCQSMAPTHAQIRCIELNNTRALFISTDGMRDCLNGDLKNHQKVIRWLLQKHEQPIDLTSLSTSFSATEDQEAAQTTEMSTSSESCDSNNLFLEQELPIWLAKLSAKGNGDDISLAFALFPKSIPFDTLNPQEL